MSDKLSLLLARISTEDEDASRSASHAGGGFGTSPSTGGGKTRNNDGEFSYVGGTGTESDTSLIRTGTYSSASLMSASAGPGDGGLLAVKTTTDNEQLGLLVNMDTSTGINPSSISTGSGAAVRLLRQGTSSGTSTGEDLMFGFGSAVYKFTSLDC